MEADNITGGVVKLIFIDLKFVSIIYVSY